MDEILISICIPGYEMGGKGALFLKQMLQTIQKQTYKNFEVIISNHSDGNELETVVDSFNDLNITIFKNKLNKGSSSSNINSAISKAKGNIIKPMFQDDFFVNRFALEIISKLPYNYHWGVCGCVHSDGNVKEFYHHLIPYWQDDIKKGANTLGGPSSIYFRKTDINFDERLLWYMDTDFYYRLFLKHGLPFIVPNALICSREDETRVSNTMITDEVVNRENKILSEKYGI
jgi:glycosyltransferase involved in cell wall biosynthesis